MADVRALLKAKRQEARITHPYASYSSSGQLRCSICGLAIKHAAAWEGHLGSKGHRTKVAKAREEEAEKQRELERKRKAEEMEVDDDAEEYDGQSGGEDGGDGKSSERKKRRRTEDVEEQDEEPEAGSSASKGGFPADFFSDPSRAPPPVNDSDSEAEAEGGSAVQKPKGENTGPGAAGDVDAEWEAFQRTVLEPATKPQQSEDDARERYAQATVFAEAKIYEAPTGMPTQEGESSAVVEETVEETEEEKRKRKEQEDREIIMDRLLEEERAQEEADGRVNLLKGRLEMLKKKRELAKAKKSSRT
ncbi:uncharacterized protein STEHIDRAFT_144371 [Stereum hirsutum FP-91666 SS1]|uniref:uncharacterized protein n=1 Tax=Stereum hirsutum (strain FP-91666) TaxID=721885 RepID=UPI000440CD97|nr:uncharacterized protein STEHIDRAFT_144371 [Stereum hirsutum FP-91666 SS1]EIM90853.1 hypothetical protein STEHIDRAFT_144371 [Stereum hirsutum FP-91666 SS1]